MTFSSFPCLQIVSHAFVLISAPSQHVGILSMHEGHAQSSKVISFVHVHALASKKFKIVTKIRTPRKSLADRQPYCDDTHAPKRLRGSKHTVTTNVDYAPKRLRDDKHTGTTNAGYVPKTTRLCGARSGLSQ